LRVRFQILKLFNSGLVFSVGGGLKISGVPPPPPTGIALRNIASKCESDSKKGEKCKNLIM
jgi:hypothetical protein